jgi:hypothetical protein
MQLADKKLHCLLTMIKTKFDYDTCSSLNFQNIRMNSNKTINLK